jgi:hypothetical protein
VRQLEVDYPPPPNLLVDANVAERLLGGGSWYLQYTSPSALLNDDDGNDEENRIDSDDRMRPWTARDAAEGSSDIETTPFRAQGTVSAAGVTIDTSRRVVQQIFSVNDRRVVNRVKTTWSWPPWASNSRDNIDANTYPAHICVAGTFRPSDRVPNRAIVAFDTATIELSFERPTNATTATATPDDNATTTTTRKSSGLSSKTIQIDLGFCFTLLALFRRGRRDNGWLETTYVDDTMRIGRGNKGTLFVLTRDPNLVQP